MTPKKTFNQRLVQGLQGMKDLGSGLKTANPLGLAKISGKKPAASKIKMGPTKITSTLPMKDGKPVARKYTK